MKVVPPIKIYSNTFKANETPREFLLERDVSLLFNENRELKEKNRKLLKLLKTYQEVVDDNL